VSAVDLALIAQALRKPLPYFFPPRDLLYVPMDELTSIETGLVDNFRLLTYSPLEQLVLDNTKRLADFARKGDLERLFDEAREIGRALQD
jgi:hypothetical protein